MSGVLRRGLVAGAAGTTAINAVTFLDMALRGRPASQTPGRTVAAALDRLGVEIPGGRGESPNRGTALGALAGIGVGLGLGVAGSAAHYLGLRAPKPLGGALLGGVAMAAADVPATALGVTDPRTWSGADWASDAVPHLAYGVVTRSVLERLERNDPEATEPERTRPTAGLVLRSAMLGLATGARSSLGAVGLLAGSRRASGRIAATAGTAMVVGELIADKHPEVPSRLEGPSLPLRLALGSSGAASLALAENARPAVPLVVGALGAAAGSLAGALWRDAASGHLPDHRAAVLEDGVALALAAAACLPRRR